MGVPGLVLQQHLLLRNVQVLTRRLPATRRGLTESGVSLLEVLLGLSIVAMVTVGLNQLSDRFAEDTKNTEVIISVRSVPPCFVCDF